MIERAAIVQEARSWLGTPYQHQQRTKGIAVDCAGLIIGVARNLGLVAADFDITGYSRQPDGTLIAYCDAHLQRVDLESMGEGDIVVTATHAAPNHFGILADYVHGGLSMVHALARSDGGGAVIEHRLAPWLRAKCMAAYSFLGVA